jgi:sugar O-acyltransferase (sialic acid O-acetyltransferase NeuD family)
MKQNLIIFGNGIAAKMAKYYFDNDSHYQIVAFTVDKDFIVSEMLEGLPVLDFSTIDLHFPPIENTIFIAVGYSKMNELRENKYQIAKKMGFGIASYISSRCVNMSKFPIGENAYILEGSIIQPFAKIGNNVTIWSGSVVGHGSIIEDNNFLSINVVVCGYTVIKNNCFLGANSTISDFVTIAEKTLVGAQSFISKNTEKGSVYVAPRAIKLDKNSSEMNL